MDNELLGHLLFYLGDRGKKKDVRIKILATRNVEISCVLSCVFVQVYGVIS